jgi:hypothetical protein
LIIQVILDGEENEGTAEWPIRGFDAGIVERLSAGSRPTKIDGSGR